MLVDGTSLGLGVLLERLNDSTAVGNVKVSTTAPKAKANGARPAKAPVNVDSGILRKKWACKRVCNFFWGKDKGCV